VLALTSAPSSPTVRTTSPDDENGTAISTLPPVSQPRDMSGADPSGQRAAPTSAAAPTPIDSPALSPAAGDPPANAQSDDDPPADAESADVAPADAQSDDDPPADAESADVAPKPGSPAVAVPPDNGPPATPATTAAPEPATTAAPPPPAVPSPQTLRSACGDVVVEIDGRTVRIASITPLPGYTSQVSTDGPESVEMKFLGTDRDCEVHAELKAGRLDVEIQNSENDD
jgi:hypothetical protein